jgi:hypothetical protein
MKLSAPSQAACIVVLLVFWSSVPSRARSATELSINQMLRDGSFDSRFPLESELVNKYGQGYVETPYEDVRWHTYFIPGDRLWLRCKIEANRTTMQPLTEVLVSRVPLATRKVIPKVRIGHLQLRGRRIGDSTDTVLQQWGQPFRSEKVFLSGIETLSYKYFPRELHQGTCLSFYVRDNVIVAFSLSSPE